MRLQYFRIDALRLVCVFFLLATSAHGQTATDPAPGQAAITPVPAFEERVLQVDINGQQLNQTVVLLEDAQGQLYLSRQDLQRWRVRLPDASAAMAHDGEFYYPISAIASLTPVYNPQKQTLELQLPAQAFEPTTLAETYATLASPTIPSTGGFINYDLNVSHTAATRQYAGQLEFGFFNRLGVGTSNFLAEQLNGRRRLTRLETSWTYDDPEKMRRLRLGDAVSSPGSWGLPLRFAGIQYGSYFGSQPGFITVPMQSAAGLADLPSTVDIFVNNALVSQQNVPPGPFSIENLPVVSGAGEVQLVMRDLLGREQIVTQPFYASQSLLRPGLSSFSYEVGVVRRNFGINSNDYGHEFGTGTYRRGMSERFTAEVRAEAMPGLTTAGVAGDYVLPSIGTLSARLAGSHRQRDNGWLTYLGIERQARPWSFGARTQWTSSGFRQLGLSLLELAPAQVSSMNLSYASAAGGSLGLALLTQSNRLRADVNIATLSYSRSLGRMGTIVVSALRDFSERPSTSVFALLSIPIDAKSIASLSAQSTRSPNAETRTDVVATLQGNMPKGAGYGYRLMTRSDHSAEAALSWQNDVGTYSLEAARAYDSNAARLGASGGLAVLGGDVFASRRLDQSFAVARIADYPNVRLLADNQFVGRTNASGSALIPDLRAYDRNVISVDQRDLPLDAQIGSLKLEVVPYFRSGVAVTFPIRQTRGATFTIRLENGQPMPMGATVQQEGKAEFHTVGEAGEVYVTGLEASNRLRAMWRNQQCEFDVLFVAGTDPLPDLGVHVCKGVNP